jgi:hypothetical protein
MVLLSSIANSLLKRSVIKNIKFFTFCYDVIADIAFYINRKEKYVLKQQQKSFTITK